MAPPSGARLSALAGLLAAAIALPAHAQDVRYYAVWSYTQNAPSQELQAESLAERTLGYWELRLDGEGKVEEAAYHGSDGALWLSVRYVEEGSLVYADVYNGDGLFVVRKSTQLRDRRPAR